MSTCGAYLHPKALLLHAQHRTNAGFSVAALPVFRLDNDSEPTVIGATLRQVLAAYRSDQPDPTDWKQRKEQFLKAAGFRSWSALGTTARSCWVDEENGLITLTPLKNEGTKGPNKGFQPFGAKNVVAPLSATDEDLGRSLLNALEASK